MSLSRRVQNHIPYGFSSSSTPKSPMLGVLHQTLEGQYTRNHNHRNASRQINTLSSLVSPHSSKRNLRHQQQHLRKCHPAAGPGRLAITASNKPQTFESLSTLTLDYCATATLAKRERLAYDYGTVLWPPILVCYILLFYVVHNAALQTVVFQLRALESSNSTPDGCKCVYFGGSWRFLPSLLPVNCAAQSTSERI